MINTWQNWNNLLDYIKLGFGADVQQIEFDDNRIIEIIKNHVMPRFSRYVPLMRYYYLTEAENLIQSDPSKIYEIKNFPYQIIKVDKVISKANYFDISQFYNVAINGQDITDFLAGNNILQSQSMVMADDTWRFFSPNRLEIIKGANTVQISDDFILELLCVHDDPQTIDPDMYEYFRDLALGEIMIYIARIRSKFSNFNTPFGNVEVNADQLKQEGEQLKNDIIQKLEHLPPDHYVYFIN